MSQICIATNPRHENWYGGTTLGLGCVVNWFVSDHLIFFEHINKECEFQGFNYYHKWALIMKSANSITLHSSIISGMPSVEKEVFLTAETLHKEIKVTDINSKCFCRVMLKFETMHDINWLQSKNMAYPTLCFINM